MDSGKRRRVVVDNENDRLSELPDCLLLDILSRVGSRLAVQTSSLSRRWRHLWRDVPCADVDEREFSSAVFPTSDDWFFHPSNYSGVVQPQQRWDRFEDFADHVLSPSSSPMYRRHRHLDAFRLHIASPRRTHTSTDRWVRRGLARCPAAVAIHAPDPSAVRWIDPSFPSLLLSRLTKLHLVGVSIPQHTPAQAQAHHILGCPALEDLRLDRCGLGYSFGAMASPTLRRLAIARPYAGHLVAADLIRAAPRLHYLRLDLICDGHLGAGEPLGPDQAPPLPALAEASIRVTHLDNEFRPYKRERKRNKVGFFRAMCRLLARLPNVVFLDLSGFITPGLLEEESQEFPTLNQLKTLLLDDCELGANFCTLSSILRNTPNLETLGLHQCKFLSSTPKRRAPSRRRGSTTTTLQCKNLKLMEIKSSQDDTRQILRLLLEVFEGIMPLAQWRRVHKASDVAGLMTMQFHRTEKGARLVESYLQFPIIPNLFDSE